MEKYVGHFADGIQSGGVRNEFMAYSGWYINSDGGEVYNTYKTVKEYMTSIAYIDGAGVPQDWLFDDVTVMGHYYTAKGTFNSYKAGYTQGKYYANQSDWYQWLCYAFGKVDTWNVETANHVIPGTTYDASTGRYIAASQGIHAKYLGDTVYLACYAKLTDGSYVYTKLASYSPVQYATSKPKGTDVALKQLVVAMLNYSAAAQTHFNHNVENLANATLTAEQIALPEAYRSDMVSTVASPSADKQGEFANNQGFAKRYPSISFEGAFCINYFFTPAYAPVDSITLYYWNAEDYHAAAVLSTANATGSIKMEGTGIGEYRGDITGIAAKNLGEGVYVAAVYSSDGITTWTSGVLGYSIGAYCASQSTKGGTIADLAMATAVYGYQAKQYFN